MQIMVALRVFASAGFQIDIGDTFGISKATVCRTVHRVANVLAGAFHRHVKFEGRADAEVTKAKFYAMAGFPQRHRVHRLHSHTYQWPSPKRARICQ